MTGAILMTGEHQLEAARPAQRACQLAYRHYLQPGARDVRISPQIGADSGEEAMSGG
jgi:hypothetical protein